MIDTFLGLVFGLIFGLFLATVLSDQTHAEPGHARKFECRAEQVVKVGDTFVIGKPCESVEEKYVFNL